MTNSRRYVRIPFLSLFLAVALVAPGCSSQPTCPAGLHPYNNKCLTNMAIQYVGCTEGKGLNVTTEIGGSVGGSFKDVADASLNLAYRRDQQENTEVALQIVRDCLDIAKTNSPPDDPELAALDAFRKRVIAETPVVTISPTTAREGQQVTVTGSRFWANEMVDIYLHAFPVAQVQADGNGSFTTTITVPANAPSFPTTITASGRSSAASGMAIFQAAP